MGNQNLEILENWYKSIKDYPRINVYQFKELYEEMIRESNPSKKQQLRDNLIIGTQYIIYNYLKSNKYYLISSSEYDMSDIIEESIRILIEKIDSGDMVRLDYLSNLFTSKSYQINHCKNLTHHETPKGMVCTYDNDLGRIIKNYCIETMKKGSIKYNEFIKFMENNYHEIYDKILTKDGVGRIKRLYSFLEIIINNTDIDELIKLTSNKLNNLAYLFYYNYFVETNKAIDHAVIESHEEEIINKVIQEKIKELIFCDGIKLTPEEIDFIIKRYGYDGKPKSLGSIANELGIGKGSISNFEEILLNKLRRNGKIHRLGM